MLLIQVVYATFDNIEHPELLAKSLKSKMSLCYCFLWSYCIHAHKSCLFCCKVVLLFQ